MFFVNFFLMCYNGARKRGRFMEKKLGKILTKEQLKGVVAGKENTLYDRQKAKTDRDITQERKLNSGRSLKTGRSFTGWKTGGGSTGTAGTGGGGY